MVIALISSFSLSHYTHKIKSQHKNKNARDEKLKGEEKKRTTFVVQYTSFSNTARTASTLSASTITKLPFISSEAASNNGPAISVVVFFVLFFVFADEKNKKKTPSAC